MSDYYTCATCDQKFVRGNKSPAEVEATARRHERSMKHRVAVMRLEGAARSIARRREEGR